MDKDLTDTNQVCVKNLDDVIHMMRDKTNEAVVNSENEFLHQELKFLKEVNIWYILGHLKTDVDNVFSTCNPRVKYNRVLCIVIELVVDLKSLNLGM